MKNLSQSWPGNWTCFSSNGFQETRTERIAEVLAQTMGCKTSSVSVAIKDVPQEEWKSKVWDGCIVPDKDVLYKKTGYDYGEQI